MPTPPPKPSPASAATGPIVPGGPVDIPPIHPIDPSLSFSALDRALPLALLPLRLEVRFWTASDPPELRVRIFPDAIHADGAPARC